MRAGDGDDVLDAGALSAAAIGLELDGGPGADTITATNTASQHENRICAPHT